MENTRGSSLVCVDTCLSLPVLVRLFTCSATASEQIPMICRPRRSGAWAKVVEFGAHVRRRSVAVLATTKSVLANLCAATMTFA